MSVVSSRPGLGPTQPDYLLREDTMACLHLERFHFLPWQSYRCLDVMNLHSNTLVGDRGDGGEPRKMSGEMN
ncbi:hypothetical protein U0070_026461 [Myodes glareolus]|uniref:Uncharacterized protein n=1 Tax=Myodes glareolus TaxID=447135 RepID=A0AAW0JJ49_MYOGA